MEDLNKPHVSSTGELRMPTEDPAVLREYHTLARDEVRHDDERRWTLFGAFLVAEALLTTLLGREHDAIVAGLGGVTAFLIGLAIWRNNVYLRDRTLLAAALEAKIGLDAGLRFYDTRGRTPKERLGRQLGYGLFPKTQRKVANWAGTRILAWAVMRTALAFSGIAWLGVALVALHQPLERALWICGVLACVVILDWIMEMRQR